VVDKYSGVVYDKDTAIVMDFDVITKEAVTVVIEIDPVDVKEVNKTQVVEAVTSITGLDGSSMNVEFVTDENGKVLRVLVLVKDEQTALAVVKEVEKVAKEESSKCSYGTICRVSKVYIQYNSSLSLGSMNSLSFLTAMIFILLISFK